MTTDSDPFLTPRPKSTSRLEVGFDPSSELNDALHRFLLPENQQRAITLRAERSRTLPYIDSDNNGVRYHHEDARRLSEDALRFRQLGGLAIAINRIETGWSREGDVQVRLGLDLTPRLRKSLGGFVLGGANELMASPPWVFVQFPHSRLREQSDVILAARYLNDCVVGRKPKPEVIRTPSSPLYVQSPRIIERAS